MSTVDESLTALVTLLALAIGLALYVWTALALGAMFRKMGDQPWKGWVPLLNLATVLRWGGFSPWLALLLLVPVANLVVWVLLVIAAHRINPGFGYRGAGMTVLAALLFLVWASILGFGPARWLGARIAGPVPHRRSDGSGEGPAGERSAEISDLFGPADPPAGTAAVAAWAPPPAPSAAVDEDDERDDVDDDARPRRADVAPAERDDPAPAVRAAAAPAEREDPAPAEPAAAAPAEPAAAAPDRARASDVGTKPVPTVPDVDDPAPARPAAERAARGWAPPPVTPPVTTPPPEWDTDMDEVSAVAPSMFPPNAAARGTHVPAPVDTSDPIVSSVPGRRSAAPPPAAPVTRLPAGSPRPWSPARSEDHDPDAFPEMSGEVSAVVGSPAAGAPFSARRSVSAQQREEEAPKPRAFIQDAAADTDDDDLDQTVIARRKRPAWALVPASGTPIGLTADVAIVGRHPASDPAHPRAQLVSISDDTRTVSKTHARLELRADGWYVTDLHSTNGVLVPTVLGTQVEIDSGSTVPAGDMFLLGDAEFRLIRGEG